jgi:ABC-type phosphate transport system ATPase subunit
LSTGERQRLALVRALMVEPDVLLLDEPTSALDDGATDAVERVITARKGLGMTVVIVTHDIDQGRRLADVQAVVDNGKVDVSDIGVQR